MYVSTSGYDADCVDRCVGVGLLQYGWNVALGATIGNPDCVRGFVQNSTGGRQTGLA